MKKIRVILTQSGTRVSKMLKSITKDAYNHVSLSVENDFSTFYSFGRKHPQFVIPGGFIKETPFSGVYGMFDHIPCCILEKEISDEQYEKVQQILQHFQNHAPEYHYAFLSVIFADTNISLVQKKKYFCSQFIAEVFHQINISTPHAPEHTRPCDFIKVDGMHVIYEGDLKQFFSS